MREELAKSLRELHYDSSFFDLPEEDEDPRPCPWCWQAPECPLGESEMEFYSSLEPEGGFAPMHKACRDNLRYHLEQLDNFGSS